MNNHYNLLFSIPIHERLEVVIDQILNYKCCNPDCAIVFHFSQGYKDSSSFLTIERFRQITEQIGGIFINPTSVRTGMDDIIQAHLSNFEYIKDKIDFDYFCIGASNESFIKNGLYDKVKEYDCGVSQKEIKGWLYEKDVFNDTVFCEYLKRKGIDKCKRTYPEGQFFKKEVFLYLFNEINTFFDYNTITVAYPREEVFFTTIVEQLKKKNSDFKIGSVYTYSAYHLTHLWNVTRLRIVLELNKRKDIYSIKRVDRNINDSVRAYLRQTLGYLDEEKELLDGICSIDRYSNTQIDWMDIKKLINPVLKNLDSVWSRIGLKPPKKEKLKIENMRIAVIMSLYKSDVLDYVKLAIESILNQSYSDFDFYIQYDGYVQKEVDDYLSGLKDERIHINRRGENKGLAYSLNELLGIVMPQNYEYIARMDADDISLSERFEKQIAYMDAHPETECLGTWAIEINSDGSEYYRKQMPETHEGCWKQFMIRDCMIHPTVIFRRSYIEKAGLYSLDTYFGEDTMMWAQGFAAGCKFANVPEYLFKFRLNDDFFNRRRGWKHAKGILTLRCKVNKMLHYPVKAYLYAIAYAGAKMMPTKILNLIYKTAR